MGAGCASTMLVFDTMMQLEEHWRIQHGIDYEMIDIDAYHEALEAVHDSR